MLLDTQALCKYRLERAEDYINIGNRQIKERCVADE